MTVIAFPSREREPKAERLPNAIERDDRPMPAPANEGCELAAGAEDVRPSGAPTEVIVIPVMAARGMFDALRFYAGHVSPGVPGFDDGKRAREALSPFMQ